MTPTLSRRLANTTSQISSSVTQSCKGCVRPWIRPFSQTCTRRADSDQGSGIPPSLSRDLLRTPQSPSSARQNQAGTGMSDLSAILRAPSVGRDTLLRAQNQPLFDEPPPSAEQQAAQRAELAAWGPPEEPCHFHVYAHRHNCHITVTKPNRGAIVSMSTGQIGFRKSRRGTYDAAFQLTIYVLDKLNQLGMHKKIQALEVVLRGFGSGREAATKILLGNEGRLLRDKIIKVSDATKIKFGGTRSPKRRRLG